jgi:(1->4)-alpha-D-glucan 1-alpha-D-glucosylmutase
MRIATSSEAEIDDALMRLDEKPWCSFAPRVVVNRDGEPCEVVLNISAQHDDVIVRWSVECEDGAVSSAEIPCSHLEVIEERALDEVHVRRRRLPLVEDLPHGYHHLRIEAGDCVGELTLIRAPARCVGFGDARLWGISLQLYAVRSASNWGMGDFADLRRAAQLLGERGADFIGLNPLHVLYLDTPQHASPYSPSSRSYISALYLHIESMVDYAECAAAQAMVEADEFQATLNTLRQAKLVDYVGVASCKRRLFEVLFEHFERAHLAVDGKQSARAGAFEQYCIEHGDRLHRHAVFEALHERFHDLRSWPQEFLAADSEAVKQFATANARRVRFFKYLQWQCAEQLAACREQTRKAAMRVGLYLDLAVGSDGLGADVWGEPERYAQGVSVGAPADDFALQGQVWGLPPWLGDRLRDDAFEPFVHCLRVNMREAGALRIDHILGLLRLFWVPAGGAATDGAYVHYPLDELLAVTALESERAGCAVVGEDLGTVPDAMREALARFGVLSYKVFYFEKHWHGDHSFIQPQHYSQDALVTLTTHDLPTMIGFWSECDLQVRHALGLFSSATFEAQQRETRARDRWRILDVLRVEGLWPPADGPFANGDRDEELACGGDPPRALIEAVYRLLARCNSALLSVQIEDALGVAEQVNVPGTVSEQPNWQRKLPIDIEHWHEHDGLNALCAAIAAER